jgi:hypothetical protein
MAAVDRPCKLSAVDLVVDAEVAVDQAIAHAAHRAPVDARALGAELVR